MSGQLDCWGSCEKRVGLTVTFKTSRGANISLNTLIIRIENNKTADLCGSAKWTPAIIIIHPSKLGGNFRLTQRDFLCLFWAFACFLKSFSPRSTPHFALKVSILPFVLFLTDRVLYLFLVSSSLPSFLAGRIRELYSKKARSSLLTSCYVAKPARPCKKHESEVFPFLQLSMLVLPSDFLAGTSGLSHNQWTHFKALFELCKFILGRTISTILSDPCYTFHHLTHR